MLLYVDDYSGISMNLQNGGMVVDFQFLTNNAPANSFQHMLLHEI